MSPSRGVLIRATRTFLLGLDTTLSPRGLQGGAERGPLMHGAEGKINYLMLHSERTALNSSGSSLRVSPDVNRQIE